MRYTLASTAVHGHTDFHRRSHGVELVAVRLGVLDQVDRLGGFDSCTDLVCAQLFVEYSFDFGDACANLVCTRRWCRRWRRMYARRYGLVNGLLNGIVKRFVVVSLIPSDASRIKLPAINM